jgi:hypothetical protein
LVVAVVGGLLLIYSAVVLWRVGLRLAFGNEFLELVMLPLKVSYKGVSYQSQSTCAVATWRTFTAPSHATAAV